jgi:hypothetical protein
MSPEHDLFPVVSELKDNQEISAGQNNPELAKKT